MRILRSCRSSFRVMLVASAVAGVASVGVGVGGAEAATVPNDGRVHLVNTRIPSAPPAYVQGASPLPSDYEGQLGNPTPIFGPGDQVIEIPGGSSQWGVPVRTNNAFARSPSQTWYFQRVGYVGLTTPQTGSPTSALGAPVYKIINYNVDGTHTCLDAAGGTGAAGTTVVSYGCNPNEQNQTNQLWVVGSSAQKNSILNPRNGSFYPGLSLYQVFNWLQGRNQATATGLQNSVLMSVASLQANGWDTRSTPVLSAAVDNIRGYRSAVQLLAGNAPEVGPGNSTWNLPVETAPASAPATTADWCDNLEWANFGMMVGPPWVCEPPLPL